MEEWLKPEPQNDWHQQQLSYEDCRDTKLDKTSLPHDHGMEHMCDDAAWDFRPEVGPDRDTAYAAPFTASLSACKLPRKNVLFG